MISARVEPAVPADFDAIRALVAAAGLPADDLADGLPGRWLVARAGGDLVGTVAVEPVGEEGLLRSLAVAPAWRARGLGEALVRAIEREAAEAGARRLILLTTTAAPFFARLGYEVLDRGALPEALRAHPQVDGLCPASATVIARTLGLSRS